MGNNSGLNWAATRDATVDAIVEDINSEFEDISCPCCYGGELISGNKCGFCGGLGVIKYKDLNLNTEE